jgi:hypothetical protein
MVNNRNKTQAVSTLLYHFPPHRIKEYLGKQQQIIKEPPMKFKERRMKEWLQRGATVSQFWYTA